MFEEKECRLEKNSNRCAPQNQSDLFHGHSLPELQPWQQAAFAKAQEHLPGLELAINSPPRLMNPPDDSSGRDSRVPRDTSSDRTEPSPQGDKPGSTDKPQKDKPQNKNW